MQNRRWPIRTAAVAPGAAIARGDRGSDPHGWPLARAAPRRPCPTLSACRPAGSRIPIALRRIPAPGAGGASSSDDEINDAVGHVDALQDAPAGERASDVRFRLG